MISHAKLRAASVALTLALTMPAVTAATGDSTDHPALQTRLAAAKSIRSQPWYVANAALLDDILWQQDGSMVFRNRAAAEYQVLDVPRWKIVTLVSFGQLKRMLLDTAGVDPGAIDPTLRSPVAFRGHTVILKQNADWWSCEARAERCTRYTPTPLDQNEVNVAPRGGVGLILRDGNLHLVSATPSQQRQLTEDASERITYGSAGLRRGRALLEPRAVWSSDGRYAVVSKLDQTGVPSASLVEWLPDGKFGSRARIRSFPSTFFGDPHPGERSLWLVDTVAGRMSAVPESVAPEFTSDLVQAGFVQFSDDDRYLYYLREADDFRSARLIELDLKTRSSRTVLTERSVDGGFLYFSGQRNPAAFRVLRARNAVLWYSEQGGFGHLYLHELDSGRRIRQLTRGNWTVLSIVRVTKGEVHFLGTSPADSAEPFNQQLYSVDIVAGRVRQHTEMRADHGFSWSDDKPLFVQSSAAIDAPAALAVRSLDRSAARAPLPLGMPAGEALAKIRESGFRVPARFRVRSKIHDRVVFGTIHLPSWATSRHRLPTIEKVYPGYCCLVAPWSFPHERGGRFSVPRFFEPQALAELGFVVVITAGPGSPLQGREYHQAQHGEGYWDADSLETHMDVLKQLAIEFPQIDLSRVGIYGHSGGGYAAARAILKYPEFYHVAVALAGNHDRRLHAAVWPMMYAGHDPSTANAMEGPENVTLAGNLRGHLLLMHGDRDNAVFIDSTMQLAGALQKARKNFDLQVVIGAGHGIDSNEYVQEYYWSYFLEHLHGEKVRVGFDDG